ncbi:MAG: rhomboid family intramembrane serine protease [Candidatus Hodarchaeota archaeon]
MINWVRRKTQSFEPFPYATVCLVSTNVIVYLILAIAYEFSIWNIFAPSEQALATWGQDNRAIIEGWQIYRLGTAMFVHLHIVHLGSNVLFLVIFSLRFEELRSSRELLLVYLASGLAGNLLTLLWGPDYLSVGASGAVFGVFGANLIFLRRYYRQQIRTALFIAFIFFTITIGVDTNVFAHAGGLCSGLLLGRFLEQYSRDAPHYRPKVQRRRKIRGRDRIRER